MKDKGLTPPEAWAVRVVDAPVAQLTIPGVLSRRRRFDIDVQLRARIPSTGPSTLDLSLEIDGARQWSRTATGATPGEIDSLDYHCRVELEPDRELRLRARASTRDCVMVELSLSATEDQAG